MKLTDKMYAIYFPNVGKWWNPHARHNLGNVPKLLSDKNEAYGQGRGIETTTPTCMQSMVVSTTRKWFTPSQK